MKRWEIGGDERTRRWIRTRRLAVPILLVALAGATLAAAGVSMAKKPKPAPAPATGPVNLLANGSFEDGIAAPNGWTLTGAGAIEPAAAHDGSRSVSLTSGRWSSDVFKPGPAGAYRALSAWFRTPRPGASGDGARLEVKWRNAAGADAGVVAGKNVRGEVCNDYYFTWAGDWCHQLFVVVVPPTATDAVVSVVADQNNVSRWVVDEVFFGPVTSAPESVGSGLHDPSPAPLPGTAAVSIDTTRVRRKIPTWFASDGELNKSTPLANGAFDPAVTSHIRSASRPGAMRFPGGNQVSQYDWEHPTSQSDCTHVQGAPKSCTGTPSPAADIDLFFGFLRASGSRDAIWTLNVSGEAPTFTVRSTGNATSALLTVDNDSLRVALSGQTDGANDLRVDFATVPTVAKVVEAVNATPGYAAAILAKEADRGGDRVRNELHHLADVNVAGADATVSVDIGNIHKNLRLLDYANNPSSTVVGPSGKTRDALLASKGLPKGPYGIRFFELGNETSFIDSESGGLDPVTMGRKLKGFAAAIHAVDPGLQVGLTGISSTMGDNQGQRCCGVQGAQYVYSMTMFREAGTEVDFIIDHLYGNFAATYSGMQTLPQHVQRVNPVRWIQDMFQKYSPDHRPDIDVYITEFNTIGAANFSPSPLVSPTYQHVNGLIIADWLGVYQTLGAEMTVHHDQTTFPFGSYVIWNDGGKKISTQAGGYALTLFNQHWGAQLVQADYRSPTYDMPFQDVGRGNPSPGGTALRYPRQTAYSSMSADGNKLYVMMINKSGIDPAVPTDVDTPLRTTLSLGGFVPKPDAKVWTYNGKALNAAKMSFSSIVNSAPSAVIEVDPNAYGITSSTIANAAATFDYTTPAHSVTVVELDRLNPVSIKPRAIASISAAPSSLPATAGSAGWAPFALAAVAVAVRGVQRRVARR